MPYFPVLDVNNTSQNVTDTFLGYNHNMKIGDGEFSDMVNMTSDFFPLLANRKKRGVVKTLTNPGGILAKEALAVVENGKLYYNDYEISGLTLTSGVKQMISMGAYLLIWPDKVYLNTKDLTDFGSIDRVFTTTGAISYQLSEEDGTNITYTSQKPTEPQGGDYWLDTTQTPHVLRRYNEYNEDWISVPTVYVKISATGIGEHFQQFDGVKLSGIAYSGGGEAVAKQYEALNGTKLIYSRDTNWIVVVGLIDISSTQTTGAVTASRSAPDMDYVCEAQNRIWGCKYGMVDGKSVNELYCCKLGDFRNWDCFMGISTDSWAASVGSDGPWTGCANYLGYPTFFKEDIIHRIAISPTGAHQVTETKGRGVKNGSWRSICEVNEVLFYLGRSFVCAYDGSFPMSMSDAFGDELYHDGVAGGSGGKYYLSMKDTANRSRLFVYDVEKRLWHIEDETSAMMFTALGDELLYIDAATGNLIAEKGSIGTPESGNVAWSATTGLIGYTTVEQKYVTRFNLRMKLPRGSFADMFIQYDSDGIWHHCGHMVGVGTNTFMLPVRPRRCDHFQFKITGSGDIRIYSFARVFEKGSDVV